MNDSHKIYQIRKKTNWILTIFITIWTIGLIAEICILAYGLITTPSRISSLIFIWIVMVFIAFLALNLISWQLRGKEILTFTDDYIEIKNQKTYFSRLIRINYFEAEEISFDNDKETPLWIRFWGIGGGKIKIEYLGRKKRFGQNLNLDEAKILANEMKVEFDKRKYSSTNTIQN